MQYFQCWRLNFIIHYDYSHSNTCAGWANAQKTGNSDPPASQPHQQNCRRSPTVVFKLCCVCWVSAGGGTVVFEVVGVVMSVLGSNSQHRV